MTHSWIARGRIFWAYLAIGTAVAFFLFPIGYMLLAAFSLNGGNATKVGEIRFTLTHFRALFEQLDAATAILNSIIIVGLSTACAMIFGSLAALAIARFPLPGKTALALEILSVRMFPPIVSAIPFFLIAKDLGLFDTHLALILIYILSGLPFVVWIMNVFIRDVPKSIEEAALIDGCSPIEAFVRVTVPILLPGIAATVVIVVMFAWNEYLFASLLTSSKAKTLPVIAAQALKPKAIDWGLASAAGVLMSAPIAIVAMFLQKYLVRGLTFGAVKG